MVGSITLEKLAAVKGAVGRPERMSTLRTGGEDMLEVKES
jgi:hypothetical protein